VDRVEAIRDVYAEWQRGNYRAGLELYDPEITLAVHNPIPDAGVYEGVEGLQRYMRRFLETWEEYEIRAESVEADGDRVIVRVHHAGSASGARVEMHYLQIWSFEGDCVVRVDIAGDGDLRPRASP
jgi:ketosteroid isomerase-like protein